MSVRINIDTVQQDVAPDGIPQAHWTGGLFGAIVTSRAMGTTGARTVVDGTAYKADLDMVNRHWYEITVSTAVPSTAHRLTSRTVDVDLFDTSGVRLTGRESAREVVIEPRAVTIRYTGAERFPPEAAYVRVEVTGAIVKDGVAQNQAATVCVDVTGTTAFTPPAPEWIHALVATHQPQED